MAETSTGARVFGAVYDGIVAIDIDTDGAIAGTLARHVTEERLGCMLAAVSLRGESLLAYAYEGDRAFGVVAAGRDRKNHVRHPLPVRCSSLAVSVGGNRAALTLGGAPTEPPQLALLGAGGKVAERAHAAFPRAGGKLSDPVAVFTARYWTLLARQGDALFAHPQDPPTPVEHFLLPGCGGPFAATKFSGYLYAAGATLERDGVRFRLVRAAFDGSAPQRREEHLDLDDVDLRRRHRLVHRTLGDLATRSTGGAGYRDHGTSRLLERDELTLRSGRAITTITLRPERDGYRLRLLRAEEDGGQQPPPDASMVRLARWVRGCFSKEARQERAATERWARDALAALVAAIDPPRHSLLSASLVRVERAGPGLVLDLWLPVIPKAPALQRLVDEVDRAFSGDADPVRS